MHAGALRCWSYSASPSLHSRCCDSQKVGLLRPEPVRLRYTGRELLPRATLAAPSPPLAGAVHHVLDRPPREGVLGAAFDFLRICWGARLFAAAMASVITPIPLLPPAPHLLLQIYTVAMIHPLRNKSLCASRLLSHPLTAGRLQLVHSWLHLVAAIPGGPGALPVRPLAGPATNHAHAPVEPAYRPASHPASPRLSPAAVVLNGAHPPSGNPQQECEEVLSFLSLSVGLLLPLLLVVKTEPASSLERWEAAQRALGLECSSSEASTSSEASGGGGHASDGARRTSGMGPRLARAWRWAEARIEEGMRLLAGRSWLAPRPPRRPISRLEELQRHRPYADVFLTPEQLHALDSLARRLDGGSGNGGGGSPAQLNAWQRLVLWWLVLSLAFVLSLVSPGWPGAPAQAAH